MPFKPNYDRERSERRRAKLAKQEKKLLEQQEAVALRKAARALETPAPASADGENGEK
jgi:hypothetical protein